MADSKYVVGIDLGTTNTALAFAELSDKAEHPKITILDIPQVVRPGSVEPRNLLPSFLYIPAENELPEGSLVLPWEDKKHASAMAIGEYARGRGKEVPGRLISSAKSWLCNATVDRRSPLLPWGAPEDVKKLSPVDVSTRILKHLAEAWDETVTKGQKGGKLKNQKIMLCVPASFDAAARDLTMEAAKDAGFEDVTLLEEPQAAFYSWLEVAGDKWRKQVKVGDLVLVVDVGGGTTDFLAHRRRRRGRLADAQPHRGRRAYSARRRQHGSRAGACGSRSASRAKAPSSTTGSSAGWRIPAAKRKRNCLPTPPRPNSRWRFSAAAAR